MSRFYAGRRLTPCPAYGFEAVCGPVARTDAPHRHREIHPLCAMLPGAALNAPCPYMDTSRYASHLCILCNGVSCVRIS
ncbi:hypothetical protein, partial [Klebsiella oxytoca]